MKVERSDDFTLRKAVGLKLMKVGGTFMSDMRVLNGKLRRNRQKAIRAYRYGFAETAIYDH